MTTDRRPVFPELTLSHFELYVHDVQRMEAFYTAFLGFVVTDRGEGADGMVFLSRSAKEHHQLVLNPRASRQAVQSPLDHISFRVASLADVRLFHSALVPAAGIPVDAVSHGTTWSIYVRDPENNRLEIFTDTPWYVDQPCKFPNDLQLGDEALHAYTEDKIRLLPGFRPVEQWHKAHITSLGAD
jgi:catechol-2,3-dioxygenase